MFRFTVRDLLWTTALVAMGTSWWLDKNRIDKAVAAFDEERMQMYSQVATERKLIKAERARVQQVLAAMGSSAPGRVSVER